MTVGARIGFLGAGQMAEALIGGVLAAQLCAADNLRATDPNPARRELMERRFGVQVDADNRALVEWADTLVVAVKPQMCEQVLKDLAPSCGAHLMISIVAGLRLSWFQKRLPASVRLVRVMPNAPALVGAGMSAVAAHTTATPADLALTQRLCEAVGRAVIVEESMLDAVTGLSGSGPAFAFVAIEAMADAGVKAGLPRDLAQRVAVAAAVGAAARRQLDAAASAVSTKTRVSPPWVTVAADAVVAATHRAQELGASCL
ncbi:MAG: pyrroline-5-carboxylate reductase [Nitrospiraceae bacterium]